MMCQFTRMVLGTGTVEKTLRALEADGRTIVNPPGGCTLTRGSALSVWLSRFWCSDLSLSKVRNDHSSCLCLLCHPCLCHHLCFHHRCILRILRRHSCLRHSLLLRLRLRRRSWSRCMMRTSTCPCGHRTQHHTQPHRQGPSPRSCHQGLSDERRCPRLRSQE